VLVAGLGGCVGVSRSHLEWVGVGSSPVTRAELRARLGEPRRTDVVAGRETWYYRLSGPAPSGLPAVTQAPNVVYLVLLPAWWIARPDDNVRFVFDGDGVVSTEELRLTERGFLCGLNFMHPGVFICGPTH
jgi:hypothetical protein